jgi:hypothetical protein
MIRRTAPLGLFLILWSLAQCGGWQAANAQVVRGHLYDFRTRSPVINGNVALRDSIGAVVARTATGDDGAYELRARTSGTYSLLAVGLGYRTTPIEPFEIMAGDTVTIDISLNPDPLRLDPLLVSAERIRTELQRQGFYERMERGRGFFLTPEALKRRPPITEAEVIRRAPFVEINRTWTGSTVRMRNKGRQCRPLILVDDMPGMGTTLEDHVNFADIIAVEVYRGVAEIPYELAVGWNECGVIMIWTVWSEMRRKKRGGG